MRMRIAAVTMETGLLIFCACADNHVALLFINLDPTCVCLAGNYEP